MFKYALAYGGAAGAVVIAVIIVGIALSGGDAGHAGSAWLGYLVMLVALTLVFVGVKRYRDREKGGVIRFLPALGVGLSIAAVAGVVYVALWEAYLAFTDYGFIRAYADAALEAKKAKGLDAAALEAEAARIEVLVRRYANPLFRLPMTFMEIFPVGALIALVSAAILRNPRAFPAARRAA